ncbi:6-carboxytetrahydropterin synthase [Halorubrum sp. JWXQ-INN 858]|uniref:6-pyruvoyl trahydropterin synthase family protein n=1 Tax=Halorubrum sp. JWXQ-INN 858 TaxID=2690782 RepID=UPI001358B416|nr:6-carboxytetrahydropterin synthase [Halorubrum sp. JWXQ-INN 858]MWV64606.1 6-carboxytetrahydropterin synthase [Halorubrum sp. JWXQ-INN 858]
MYAVAVSRSFVAQHFLTVPDPGPREGELHSHHFTVEATFRGPDLATYGYLVDIDAVIEAVEAVVDGLCDETLNDLPAFEGRNPSAERLARVFGDRLVRRLEPDAATELEVSVREDDVATVAHTRALQ